MERGSPCPSVLIPPLAGEGKGFPSILHFVPRHRRGVEGRSSGSKDTLKGR